MPGYMEDKDAGYFIDRMSNARNDAAKCRILDEWHRWATDSGDAFELLYWMYRSAGYRADQWEATAAEWKSACRAKDETIKLQAETIKIQTEIIADLKEMCGYSGSSRRRVAGFGSDLEQKPEHDDTEKI